MGSYDWAEICEIVGLYSFKWLSTVIDKNGVDLYRDNGLAAINNKATLDIFNQYRLKMVILRTLEKIETERVNGLIHHIHRKWKQLLINCSSSLWRSSSPGTMNNIIFSL